MKKSLEITFYELCTLKRSTYRSILLSVCPSQYPRGDLDRQFCMELGVRNFPTILAFPRTGGQPFVHGSENRSMQMLLKFANMACRSAPGAKQMHIIMPTYPRQKIYKSAASLSLATYNSIETPVHIQDINVTVRSYFSVFQRSSGCLGPAEVVVALLGLGGFFACTFGPSRSKEQRNGGSLRYQKAQLNLQNDVLFRTKYGNARNWMKILFFKVLRTLYRLSNYIGGDINDSGK
mmetsp:Transcript_34243/g.65412  ORF Transcript_34243/g.65412 Transcript_34243/m.65412 type:complete len:235 (+) Transcript_34243:976-1680(+)